MRDLLRVQLSRSDALRTLCALCLLGASACGDDSGQPSPEGGMPDEYPYGLPWDAPFDATDLTWLLSVWGPDEGLYAVGGSPDEGIVMRVEGDDWREMPLPDGVPGLNWVFGFSDEDVWSVGYGGTILHWDGSAWELQASPVERDLWGVWGAAPDDLWAVGGNGTDEGQATLLHFDGQDWQQETVIDFERASVFALFKVWGTSADNVYAVGQKGAVMHYDGQGWSELFVGVDQDLIALWGTGPDHIVMVGGRAAARIVTWDGEQFRGESLAPLPGLNGVWMREPGVVHVVGAENALATVDFDTLEFEEEDALSPLRMDFHAVFGDASGRLTAVGGNLKMTSGPHRGIVRTRVLAAGE